MTLSSKFIFFSVVLVPYFLSLKGEILNLKADDPGVLDALDFAMNELNAIRNNLYRLMSTKVEDAIVQVKTQLCLNPYINLFQFKENFAIFPVNKNTSRQN